MIKLRVIIASVFHCVKLVARLDLYVLCTESTPGGPFVLPDPLLSLTLTCTGSQGRKFSSYHSYVRFRPRRRQVPLLLLRLLISIKIFPRQ